MLGYCMQPDLSSFHERITETQDGTWNRIHDLKKYQYCSEILNSLFKRTQYLVRLQNLLHFRFQNGDFLVSVHYVRQQELYALSRFNSIIMPCTSQHLGNLKQFHPPTCRVWSCQFSFLRKTFHSCNVCGLHMTLYIKAAELEFR